MIPLNISMKSELKLKSISISFSSAFFLCFIICWKTIQLTDVLNDCAFSSKSVHLTACSLTKVNVECQENHKTDEFYGPTEWKVTNEWEMQKKRTHNFCIFIRLHNWHSQTNCACEVAQTYWSVLFGLVCDVFVLDVIVGLNCARRFVFSLCFFCFTLFFIGHSPQCCLLINFLCVLE